MYADRIYRDGLQLEKVYNRILVLWDGELVVVELDKFHHPVTVWTWVGGDGFSSLWEDWRWLRRRGRCGEDWQVVAAIASEGRHVVLGKISHK